MPQLEADSWYAATLAANRTSIGRLGERQIRRQVATLWK
jgi:hypothetical protein